MEDRFNLGSFPRTMHHQPLAITGWKILRVSNEKDQVDITRKIKQSVMKSFVYVSVFN